MNVSDKVQVGESTTGTSTSTNYTQTYHPCYQTEKGWECPRCRRINAPWVRQCDCSGNNWTVTSDWIYKPEWWKTHVTCQGSDATTTWSAINNNITNSSCTSADSPWNQFYTLTQEIDKIQNQIKNLKEKD